MSKAQISSVSIISNSQLHNSQVSSNIQINAKKQKQSMHMSKQNESKHMNSIKPYVQGGVKQRKISKRQSQKNLPTSSPYIQQNHNLVYPYQSTSKSKNKKGDSLKKVSQQQVGSKNIGDLYTELINIKSQYKTLKNSYNGLLKQHEQLTEREQREATSMFELKKQLQRVKKEQQKNKSNLKFMEQEMDRLKKQCVRMVEAQKFKNKKLQETIQQKQLMIAYLRSQLAVLNGQTSSNTGFFFQHTAPSYLQKSSANISNQHGSFQNQILVNNNLINQIAPNIHVSNPASQAIYCNNVKNMTRINKSIINSSNISNIDNISSVGVSELIDLPRQINKKKIKNQQGQAQNLLINSITKKVEEKQQRLSQDNQNKIKREYIFSNQDDSLSFSYQKSKESLKQQEHDSIQSSDHTILTFTKKDVYVLDQQDQESQIQPSKLKDDQAIKYDSKKQQLRYQNSKKQSIQNKIDFGKQQEQISSDNQNSSEPIFANQQKSSYTGQQEIMTFQNRYGQKNSDDISQIISSQLEKQKRKNEAKAKEMKHKIKLKDKFTHRYNRQNPQNQKKQVSSKSKLLTKRLQINTDELGLIQDKQSSIETKKRPATQAGNSKTGKKKLSRKRRSEQGGSMVKKPT